MANVNVQLINFSKEELNQQIETTVKSIFDNFISKYQQTQTETYLTRQEVAAMFKVDISTIANWQKNGKLKPYALSGRIYFLRSEVEQSLIPIT